MDITGKEKALSAMSYISWLFLLIGLLVTRNDRSEFETHHFNQSIMLQIAATITSAILQIEAISSIGEIISFAVTVFLLWGVVDAIRGSTEDIPVLSAARFFK